MLHEGFFNSYNIGKWWVMGHEDQPFYGYLVQEKDYCVLSTEVVGPEIYGWIGEKQNFIVHGQIGPNSKQFSNDKITLRGVNLDNRVRVRCEDGGEHYESMNLIFEDCFIGSTWVPETVVAKSAYVKYSGLGAWFRKNSYQEHIPFSQDSLLLSFQQHNPLSFSLDGFDLQFDFGLSYSEREWNNVEYETWVNTIFSPKERPIKELYERVNQFAQLLSMFRYGNLQISSMMIETTSGFNGEYIVNGSAEEEIMSGFWLAYPDVASCFGDILQNWFHLAGQAQPVLEIFMQALAFSEATISELLMVIQALEIYSNTFRSVQAKQYAERVSDLPDGQTAPVELAHKLCDLLLNSQAILGFSEVELWKLANKIAASREYYLHYDSSKKYDCLTAEQTGTLLVFLQAALKISLLQEIGVSEEALQKAGLIADYQEGIYHCILKKPQISSTSSSDLITVF